MLLVKEGPPDVRHVNGFLCLCRRFAGQLKLYYSKIGRGLILNSLRTLTRRAAPSAVLQSGFIRGIPDE